MHRVHNLFPDDCRRPALAIATLAHLPFVPTGNLTGNVFSCSTLLRCFTGETISLLTFYIVRSHHIRWWNAISNLQHRILEMKSWGRSPLFIVHRFYIGSSRFITFIVMESFLWLIQFIFTFFDTFVSGRWEICKIGYEYTSNVTNILWMFRNLWFKGAKIYRMHRMYIIMQKCMKYQRCSYLADEREEREKLICIKIHSLVRNFWLSKFS